MNTNISLKWNRYLAVCVHAELLQLCPALCNPMDCSPPGSSAYGIIPCKNTAVGSHALLQGILLIQRSHLCLIMFPALAGRLLTSRATWEAPSIGVCQSLCRVQLWDPMDCSPPGSSVHGILWARMLKWFASPFSGDLPDPGIEPRSPA